MAEVKRRLAAIFVADAVAYSRLMGDDEQATLETLDTCRAIFSEHISRHDGRVVDMAGDSVLAVFDSVVEAVESAVSIQDEIAGRNADLSKARRLLFRIGVNLGDVIVKSDGTVYGDGVNVAARLENLAAPGGVMISESAHMQVRNRLEIGFEDAGAHAVKNIAETVRAYRIKPLKRSQGPDGASPMALPDKPSVAVLSFNNMSGDLDQEHFADGIAEDLITGLSRIRWLFVTARNSSFTYKGRAVDVKKVGSEMGVRYVVEGSVRKSGDRIRVSAQLVDAIAGTHIWAERFDRRLTDIFDLQDELTGTIAGAIEPELAAAERERARRKPPESLDAWENYQCGVSHMYEFTAEGNVSARRYFDRAVKRDPTFALPVAGNAYTHFSDIAFGYTSSKPGSLRDGFELARRAVAADDREPMAHWALGRLHHLAGDPSLAINELETAIALNPSFAAAHFGLGLVLWQSGDAATALSPLAMAERLSPFDPFLWLFQVSTASAHTILGDYHKALRAARDAVQHPNAQFWAHAILAGVLGYLGRSDEASKALLRLQELRPDFSRALIKTIFPSWQGEALEAYLTGLRKAGLDI